MTTRRGFTLIEVLVGLVLTLMVGGVVFELLTNNQRVSRGQMAQTSMQDNVRSGALVVVNELREVGYDNIPAGLGLTGSVATANPDLITIQPGWVRYKATRGTGFTCAAPTTSELRLKKSTFYGIQVPPAQNDSVAVYVEGDRYTTSDDSWVHGQITGAAASGTCVDGVTPAWVLPVAYSADYTNLGTVFNTLYFQGGPVRILEVMEMKYYGSGGSLWLGMRSVTSGGAWEPVVGPLADSTLGTRGLTFEYLDVADAATAVQNDVRTVRVTLTGITDEAVRHSGAPRAAIDSLALQTRVALRNTLRP